MNPLENIDGADPDKTGTDKKEAKNKDYIKWVDFGVTSEAMNQAFRLDVDTCQADVHLNWWICWPIWEPVTAGIFPNISRNT